MVSVAVPVTALVTSLFWVGYLAWWTRSGSDTLHVERWWLGNPDRWEWLRGNLLGVDATPDRTTVVVPASAYMKMARGVGTERQVEVEDASIVLDLGADGDLVGIETIGRPLDVDVLIKVLRASRWVQ